MASGPWGGYSNGKIPLAVLVDVVGDGAEGHYLHPAAAYYFKLMQRDCFEATGVWLGVDEGYRTYETQAWYAGPNSPLPKNVARATPGTSKHGWALAVDMTGWSAAWGWLMAHEGDYGFSWAQGRNDGEQWHHTFEGSLDTSQLNWAIFDAAPIVVDIVAQDTDMLLFWTVEGSGYLATPNGIVGLASPAIYNLFYRLINADQLRTPFAGDVAAFIGASNGFPMQFNEAERGIIDGHLRLLAQAAAAGIGVVDTDAIVAAMKGKGLDVTAAVDADQIADKFIETIPAILAAQGTVLK